LGFIFHNGPEKVSPFVNMAKEIKTSGRMRS